MKKYSDFEAKVSSERASLPVGGYVCKIMAAEEIKYDWGSKLKVSFDVAEGEYKGFYTNDYKSQSGEDKKWRGVIQLTIPVDDGTEQDGWAKRSFNNFIGCIEDANDYHWNWEEKTLKDKLVGVLTQNAEWEWNGKSGWAVKPARFVSVESIRTGTFKPLADKPLKNKSVSAPAASTFAEIDGSDDDLPF